MSGGGGRVTTGAGRATDDITGVLIIEDHAMIAEGLRVALERVGDMRVLGIAGTMADGARLTQETHPDVVVMDFRLPDGEAPTGIGTVHAIEPDARVLVISAMSDFRSVIRALEAGASGYLLKDQPIDDLVAAIRTVRRGEQALAPSLVPKLIARLGPAAPSANRLSRREIEILQLMTDGVSTADMAKRLNLSVNTVRNHVQSVLTRLGAHSKLEAVSIAMREGIVKPPDSGTVT
jgi:DNA-binding NarL/FixJ family response regulator